MRGALYDLALTVPWCITDGALEAMLAIAAREPIDPEAVAAQMHGPKSLALRADTAHADAERMTVRDGVATIAIDGPIYRYADMFTAVSGGVTTEALARDIQTAVADPAIRAIILRIDSPGGEATGIHELAQAIRSLAGATPIAAYIEGYGASAAYWLACACAPVWADATALVGSIGTVMSVLDPAKQQKRTIEFVSAQSPKKRPDPTTPAGRGYLQSLVDEMTRTFIADVVSMRGLTEADVLAVEGGLLVGQQAVDAGLVDQLGSEEELRAMLAQGRELTGTPTRRPQEKRHMTAKEGFWASFWSGAREAGIVPATETALGAVVAGQAQETIAVSDSAEITRLRAEVARLRAEQIQKDASAFAAAELASSRALPAEQAAIVALYARAAEIDAATPRTDAQPSCVALVRAAYGARPVHQLSTPLVNATAATVLATPTAREDAEVGAARKSAQEYAAARNSKK